MLRKATPFVIVLLIVISGGAAAQIPGTLFGQVFDENDEPLEGVRIFITNPESDNFSQEEFTDDNGRFQIFLRDATPTYVFAFTKDGYQPFNLTGFKVVARKRTRRDFTLRSLSEQQKQIIAGAAETPAEEVETKGSPVKLYNDGFAALQDGRLAEAETLFRASLDKKAEYGPAFGGLARVFAQQEKWQQALEAAQKSQQLNPDDTDINQVLYASYNGLGQTDKANEILAVMQASDPERAGKNSFNAAADLYNEGNLAEAKLMFEAVLESQPDHAKSHYMLGLCYLSEGSNDEAKEHLNRFLELAPRDPDAATAKEMLGYLE